MKEKIDNKELIKRILTSLNKSENDDFTDDELASIENIALCPKLINGILTGINIEDIAFFPNLKSLTLREYQMTMRDLELITSRKEMENISFINCGFDDISFDNVPRLPDNLRFISCDHLPPKFPNIRRVRVSNSDIDFNSINLSVATELCIQASNIRNAHDIDEYKNIILVNFDGSDLIGIHGNPVHDIKVSPNTLYTHRPKMLYETKEFFKQEEQDIER